MTFEKIAFVGEDNAGASQLAIALSEDECARRTLDFEVITGGIAPGDDVQDAVVTVLAEDGIDIDGRTPREIRDDDLRGTDYIVTIDCSICDFKPTFWRGPAERWDLEHSEAVSVEAAREQREEIRTRVEQLFSDLERMSG
ncbi:low molecular weight phosphatase family protein [Natrialbaceae archaeon A-arb3/5]